MAICETSVEIEEDQDSDSASRHHEKIVLTIISTPGFGENVNNELCISELTSFLEQQFDLVLAEETKVHRNTKFVDPRVHLCLYFIQPGDGLTELDVKTMSSLAPYVNILPVLARADSYTPNELTRMKQMINDDLKRFKIPVFEFQFDDDEQDIDLIEEVQFLRSKVPFAVIGGQSPNFTSREYPWGKVDVMDNNVSDTALVKSVVLGSHLQEFKDITHDFLYERYRTNRLSSVVNTNGSSAGGLSKNNQPEPSMSNLKQIAQSESMKKLNPNYHASSSQQQPLDALHEIVQRTDQMSIISETSISEDNVSTVVINNTAADGSVEYSYPEPVPVDKQQIRKISQTVPYVLRQQSIRTKQAKLEDLERQSALELAKRAAELEQRAMLLREKERLIQSKLNPPAEETVAEEGHTEAEKDGEETDLTRASFVPGDDRA